MKHEQVLVLAPRTLKGRNVIARHGRSWTVTEERERVREALHAAFLE